jgi:predicted Fe-Mo cluster-binding NifX family protein
VKVAMTIWGNRISPVFDSANTLMVVNIENSKIVKRKFEEFDPNITTQILSILNEYKIDVLICGAITDTKSKTIEQIGVKLLSFITGDADKVLVSYVQKSQRISDFLMPR